MPRSRSASGSAIRVSSQTGPVARVGTEHGRTAPDTEEHHARVAGRGRRGRAVRVALEEDERADQVLERADDGDPGRGGDGVPHALVAGERTGVRRDRARALAAHPTDEDDHRLAAARPPQRGDDPLAVARRPRGRGRRRRWRGRRRGARRARRASRRSRCPPTRASRTAGHGRHRASRCRRPARRSARRRRCGRPRAARRAGRSGARPARRRRCSSGRRRARPTARAASTSADSSAVPSAPVSPNPPLITWAMRARAPWSRTSSTHAAAGTATSR